VKRENRVDGSFVSCEEGWAVSSEPVAPGLTAPDKSASGNLAGRIFALIEVLAAFALVHLSYRSFKHFTELGRAEGATGLNFSPGSVMILFTVAMLLLCRRYFAQYALTLKGWRYNLNIGLVWEILFIAVAVLVIKFSGFHFDPLRPPDMERAFVATGGELLNALFLLWFLRRERSVLLCLPAVMGLLILFGLLSIPLIVALHFNRPFLSILLAVLWNFFCAGFGEEIFFRGYIQSRVNWAFGRPFRFLGVDFGFGLLVSSVLFGFIHVLNTVDYFGRRFDFAWWWWLPNFASGLFYGLLRERTKSILAGGIMHGLTDVLACVPALLP
jgi:membrane protease YdiL (CAAX protease family)